MILKSMGDYRSALTSLEEALAIPALGQNPSKLVYALHTLGQRASLPRRSRPRPRLPASMRRNRPGKPAAHSAVLSPHVDRAHLSPARTHRRRAQDVSKGGRAEPARPPRRWTRPVAESARRRALRPREGHGSLAVRQTGGAAVCAAGGPRGRGRDGGPRRGHPRTPGVSGRGGRSLEDGGVASPRAGRRQGRARCARGIGADGAAARGLAGRRDSRVSSRAGARDDARRQSPGGRAPQHARDSRMAKREVSRGAPALRGRARAGTRPGRPRARRLDAQQPRRDAEPAPPARRGAHRARRERRAQPGARRTTARGARARRARRRVACPGPGRDRRHVLRAVALAPPHARRSHRRGMDAAAYRGDARGERRRVKGRREWRPRRWRSPRRAAMHG